MNGIRTLVLAVSAAALICAILQETGKVSGTAERILRFSCGLFLIAAALAPLLQLELPVSAGIPEHFSSEGAALSAQAQKEAQAEMDSIIQERVSAYILDKAEPLGAKLTVTVRLDTSDQWSVPNGVTLSGQVSPFAKARLTQIIETDIGIPASSQEWSP